MTQSPHTTIRSSSGKAGATRAWRASDEWCANWTGVGWLNFGLRAWTLWLRQCNAALQPWRIARAESGGDDRRGAGIPWVPQIESTVVPFRRRDDQPGSEAEKLSMRIPVPPLPWEKGGGRVIAIESLRPRPTGPTGGKPPTRH